MTPHRRRWHRDTVDTLHGAGCVPQIPAFINGDGSLLAAFVEQSFRAASRYAVCLRDPRRKVCATKFSARDYSRIVPWLKAGH
jgi:hypothetical protein